MHVACEGEMRNAYRILAGKILRTETTWWMQTQVRVGNIPIDLKEAGYMNVNWIHLIQDIQMAGCFDHINESSGFMKDRKFIDQQSDFHFFRKTLSHGVS